MAKPHPLLETPTKGQDLTRSLFPPAAADGFTLARTFRKIIRKLFLSLIKNPDD